MSDKLRIKAMPIPSLSGHQLTNSSSDTRPLLKRPYIRHFINQRKAKAAWADIARLIEAHSNNATE